MLTQPPSRPQTIQIDLKPSQRRKLVVMDKKYALMTDSTQRQVTNQLQGTLAKICLDELDFLLGRKERELMKKRKLKEMEECYEKERNSRIKKMDFKLSRSDKNRQMSLKNKRLKTKSQLDNFEKIVKKNQNNNEQSLEKSLSLQKKIDERRTVSRSSATSLNQQSSRLTHMKRKDSSLNIESQIESIEAKLEHAKTNSQFYFIQVAQKAKEYSKDFDDMVRKVRAQSVRKQNQCIKAYYKRAIHIAQCSQKSKSFYQRESQRKKKQIQQKFTKARRNLREVDRLRQSKLDDLQSKFSKSCTPKSWRNERSESYLQKFFKNQQELEQEKDIKAQLILKKHQDLSLKNKALRQKKDRIIQTVKKIDC